MRYRSLLHEGGNCHWRGCGASRDGCHFCITMWEWSKLQALDSNIRLLYVHIIHTHIHIGRKYRKLIICSWKSITTTNIDCLDCSLSHVSKLYSTMCHVIQYWPLFDYEMDRRPISIQNKYYTTNSNKVFVAMYQY